MTIGDAVRKGKLLEVTAAIAGRSGAFISIPKS
jgi:hypothetical protein